MRGRSFNGEVELMKQSAPLARRKPISSERRTMERGGRADKSERQNKKVEKTRKEVMKLIVSQRLTAQ